MNLFLIKNDVWEVRERGRALFPGGPAKTMNGVKKSGFTLIELLVVIAIIAILAAMLFTTLSKAKQRGLTVACLNNLRQLSMCTHLYASDNSDVLVPNNSVYGLNISAPVAAGASWCLGSARYDHHHDEHRERNAVSIQQFGCVIYHCPADLSTIEDQDGNKLPQLRNRSYNMGQSVNGYPEFDNFVFTHIPSFKKFNANQGAKCFPMPGVL